MHIMVEVDAVMYLVSSERIARLEKCMPFSVMPRVGEFVKINNREEGDYFAFQVTQVTHRESSSRPEIWLRLMALVNGVSQEDLLSNEALDTFSKSYVVEDWTLVSCKVKTAHSPNSSCE